MKMLGPSRPWDEFELGINAVDGTTVTSATLSWRRKVGARYAKSERKMAVRAKRGAR